MASHDSLASAQAPPVQATAWFLALMTTAIILNPYTG